MSEFISIQEAIPNSGGQTRKKLLNVSYIVMLIEYSEQGYPYCDITINCADFVRVCRINESLADFKTRLHNVRSASHV